MAKHNVITTREQLFLKNLAVNLQLAEIEDSLKGKRSFNEIERRAKIDNYYLQTSSEYFYHTFMDGLNEGALTLSTGRIILYCNKRFAQLLNSTVEAVIGSQLDSYVLPDDRTKLESIYKSEKQQEKSIDILCLPEKGGSPVMLRLSVHSFPEEKASEKVFLIAYDISTLINTENELRQAQCDSENRDNERTSKLMLANEDLIASRIATLSMMEDAVEAKNSLEVTNRQLVEEIIERKRSELIQQVLFSISNAVLVTRDIEELISIVQFELGKLLDTKNFYIAFYDEASDFLSTPYITDKDEKEEKDEMNSYPADKSLTAYVVKNRMKLLINKKEIQELIRLGKIGHFSPIARLWLGVPLEVDGRVIGALVVQSFDKADAYEAKDLDMLEFIAHQISISLQRKKAMQDLSIALLKAEESDRLKTAFLQNISHEIRTPMNAILGFSDLLNEPDIANDTRTTYSDIIRKSGNHLLTILEDIINISELEAGKEVLRSGKTNLNPLLRDVYEQYKINAGKKNIELKLDIALSDEQAIVITDETKLIQIVTNLLNNSLKFTRQGCISFGYALKNRTLEFYVEDTGVGISIDKYNDIFDRFKQVEVVLSNENGGRGLGLGLSISKAYVELMGGKIWLKSEPGKGSVFYFSIPYFPITRLKKQVDEPSTDKQFSVSTNRNNIIIAEDVKHNYLLMSELFAGLHVNLIWVRNGLEALQTCKAVEEIDMVIMDLNMPKMDGFEAASLIRVFMPDVPVIAQSYIASAKEKKEALACGFNEYLEKPLEVSQIIALTNKYMGNYFNIYNMQNQAS